MDSDSIVASVKTILPTRFLLKTEAEDAKLAAYVSMALNDINITPPATSYTVANAPSSWEQVLIFTCTTYATLFIQLGYALKDFNWSDGGLTIAPDRFGKLTQSHERMMKIANRQIWALKRKELVGLKPKGLGSIAYQMAAASPSNTLSGVIRSTYGIQTYTPNDAQTGY